MACKQRLNQFRELNVFKKEDQRTSYFNVDILQHLVIIFLWHR